MSDYSQTTDFSAKDALSSGDPEKIILGADVDVELDAISTAITSKYDSADLASQAEAEAEALNTVLMTPLRVANWADANGGMVGDIQALADPGADAILGWDDSAGAAIGFTLVSGELEFVNATIGTGSNVPLLDAQNTFTRSSDGASRQFFDNDSTGASASADLRISAGTTDSFVGVTGSGNSSAIWTNGPTATHMYIGTNGAAPISFGTSGVERMRIAGDGSEIQFDATLFDFNGSANFSSVVDSEAGSFRVNSSVGGSFGFTDDLDTFIFSQSADLIRMRVGGSDALSVSQSEIDLTATTLDLNGNTDISGTLAVGTVAGGGSFSIMPGSSDHAYMSWYGDTSSPSTRFGYAGVAGAGSTTITIAAEQGELQLIGTNTLSLTSTLLDLNGALAADTSSAASVGYLGTPQNEQNGNYTLVIGDMGKTIYKSSGGAGETITIPANASVAFPVGTIIAIINDGGGDLSIAITSDTLEQYVTGSTGTRTLSDNGKAIIEKVASTTWKISGSGVT